MRRADRLATVFPEMKMAMTRWMWGVLLGTLLIPTSAQAQDEVVYYHTDAIGSVRMVTDASGAVVARYDYLPFGELWPTVPPNPTPDVRQFAGKERDTETKLDYVGARYYSSQTGLFTSVDPLLEVDKALLDPQRWNRYAYALNNPLKFTDPDGRSATLIGGLVGGAVGGSFALLQGASWREIGAAAAGGAVSGAMLGSVVDTGGASLPVLLGAGALAGLEGRLLENAINGRSTTAQDAAVAGAAGAAGIAAGQLMTASARTAIDRFSRQPLSLMDEMVMGAAKQGKGIRIIESLGDPKYKGMEKWMYGETSRSGLRSEVHYVRDPKTGRLMDFKFKHHGVPEER
jgi:RHS repeat-associated protein